MRLIRKTSAAAFTAPLAETEASTRLPPWKILVVDDEVDVRALTRLSLREFTFLRRGLELVDAGSADEAMELLERHPDIAVALIDVVMETDDAGLELVRHIREDRRNSMMRLIVRTGQPGMAPERYVIDNFDIDDYKDKTELTVQKLYTAVRTALKSYRDLSAIEMNRVGLEHVLSVTPELYHVRNEALEEFFRGVLTQIIALCKLGASGLITTVDGLVSTIDGDEVHVRAGAGDLASKHQNPRLSEVLRFCCEAVRTRSAPPGLRKEAIVVPLEVEDRVLGFVYLEAEQEISDYDRHLITVFANQCAAALENLRLHANLRQSYEHALDMLALVAEYKDSTTGAHLYRMAEYTRMLAIELGMSTDEAEHLAKASRLHDVGKVGIPDEILKKSGSLTAEERAMVNRHTVIGADILAGDPAMALAREVAHYHHEHYDGSGYPRGLAGEDLPLGSRIVAVVDVFDALVSRRPYKKPWTAEKAIEELRAGEGRQFDPRVVEAMEALYRRGEFDAILEQTAVASESGYEKRGGGC